MSLLSLFAIINLEFLRLCAPDCGSFCCANLTKCYVTGLNHVASARWSHWLRLNLFKVSAGSDFKALNLNSALAQSGLIGFLDVNGLKRQVCCL